MKTTDIFILTEKAEPQLVAAKTCWLCDNHQLIESDSKKETTFIY